MHIDKLLFVLVTAMTLPSFAANTTDSADKDLSSPMTINVASSDTLTWTGAITGAEKLTKTGTGTLILKHDNSSTFSGEIEVAGGAVRMDTAGAFGTGTLTSTVTPTAGKVYGFIFNVGGATVPNDIVLANTTARDETTYDLQAKTNVTFTGSITATAGGVNFYDGGAAVNMTIEGPVTATGKIVWLKNAGRADIKAPITASILRLYNTGNRSSVHFHPLAEGQSHTIGSMMQKQMDFVAEGENTLPFSSIGSTCAAKADTCFDIDLNGCNQTLKGLTWSSGEHMGAAAPGACVRSAAGPATLFLKPTGNVSCYYSFVDEVSIVMDTAGKTQAFANRTATTTGDLIVSNGTVKLSEDMSFPNLRNVYVCANAVIQDLSAMSGSFGGADTVTLEANASFELATTATAPFDFKKTKLDFAANSKFKIPAGMTVEVAELWVGGVKQPNGTYVKGSPACLTGDGTLVVEQHNFTTNTWNGGAGTPAVSLAANWSGATPDLASGDMTAEVAAGPEMTLDADVKFMGLSFGSDLNGFTIGGTGSMRLASGGLTVAAGTGAREWTFNAPIEVKDSGTWTFPAGDTLKTTGGISGSGSIAVSAGSVRLEGDNTFTGTLSLEGGSLSLKGTLGTSGDAGKLQQVSDSYPVTLDGVEIFKPCTLGGSATALYCAAGSSNVIHGKIGGCIYPTMPADSTLVIDGEMYIDSSSWTPGTHVKGTNIWTCVPYVRGLGTLFRPSACTAIYAVPTESTFAKEWYLTYNTSHTRFDVDNVCKRRMGYVESTKTATGIARCEGASSSCDLNGTVQTFNGCAGTKGTVYSDAPAALVIAPLAVDDYASSKNNTLLYPDSTFGAQLQGPVTLKFAPSGKLTDPTTLTIAERAYESTGSLEVTNGTMIVAANATFKQLALVSVTGAGVFDLRSADAFNDELTLALGEGEGETGELKVAAGTLLRVRTITVNGVECHVRPGAYSTEQFAAKLGAAFEGRVTGDGHIRVTGAGTQLLLR